MPFGGTGCLTRRGAVVTENQKPASFAPGQPYTRIGNPDSNTMQLQIALRKFLPAHRSGPAIWLVAVMHVGEPAYYQQLQLRLDSQSVVLYEGVNAEAHQRRAHSGRLPDKPEPVQPAPKAGQSAGASFQTDMARALGLVFQLDAIDYDRPNFLNSDLSIAELQRILAQGASSNAAPAPASQSFDMLLHIMDGSSFLGSLLKWGMDLISASPKLQALARLTMIESIGHLKGDLVDMKGLPPDMKDLLKVLIEQRNKKVLKDLQSEMKTVPRSGSIAIFYGAGHMENLEKHLVNELHLRPASEEWLNAFSLDLKKSGVTPSEAEAVRNMVKWQFDQMK
jgi:hypothetical protein